MHGSFALSPRHSYLSDPDLFNIPQVTTIVDLLSTKEDFNGEDATLVSLVVVKLGDGTTLSMSAVYCSPGVLI